MSSHKHLDSELRGVEVPRLFTIVGSARSSVGAQMRNIANVAMAGRGSRPIRPASSSERGAL